MRTYIDNERALLEYFINTYYLPGAFSEINNNSWKQGISIELDVNPKCNQKCEYCYLSKYGSELFPNGNVEKQKYLTNLNILLDFLMEKKIWIQRWSIFGGDLFTNDLLFDMLDKFNTYYKSIDIWPDFALLKPLEIIIPNNLSYMSDDSIFNKLHEYIEKLKSTGLVVGFSWSTDGKYCVDTREQKNFTDEYWDDMFEKSVKLNCGYHPMISASNVSNWIKNYNWWRDMFEKHNVTRYYEPGMLEVRNDDWTTDKIQEYIKLLKHIFDRRLKDNSNDIVKMAAFTFCGDGRDGSICHKVSLDPLRTNPFIDKEDLENATCSLQNTLFIELGELELIPCHRTSYKQFRGGNFIIKNNKICGVSPHNVTTYIGIATYSSNLLPKCSSCVWNQCCPKGCLGAQFEHNGELFLPIESVCNLYKCKYTYLFKLFNESGLLQAAIDHKYLNPLVQKFYVDKSNLLGYNLNE